MINLKNKLATFKRYFSKNRNTSTNKQKGFVQQFKIRFNQIKSEPKSRSASFLDGFITALYISGLINIRRVGSLIFFTALPKLSLKENNSNNGRLSLEEIHNSLNSSIKRINKKLITGTASLCGQIVSSGSFVSGLITGTLFVLSTTNSLPKLK